MDAFISQKNIICGKDFQNMENITMSLRLRFFVKESYISKLKRYLQKIGRLTK